MNSRPSKCTAGAWFWRRARAQPFLPFPGWTQPGVVGAGGLQALVKGGFPVAGRRVVVAGAGPLLLAAAGLLGLHGAKILGVYEQTSLANLTRFSLQLWTFPKKILEAIGLAMAARGVPLRAGWWVTAAGGANTGLEWVKLTDGWRETKVECDLLACGYGLRPNTELAQAHWLPPERGRGRSGRIPKHQRGRCSGRRRDHWHRGRGAEPGGGQRGRICRRR